MTRLMQASPKLICLATKTYPASCGAGTGKQGGVTLPESMREDAAKSAGGKVVLSGCITSLSVDLTPVHLKDIGSRNYAFVQNIEL